MIDINELIKRHPSLKDLIDYMKTVPVGTNLPGEREVADVVGWNRCTVRENMRALEPYGYVEIRHGKPTKYLKPV